MESRARCAGFSVTEIGNRKERLRVREAGASAAGRGQRPYASFPGFLPLNPLRTPSPPLKRAGTPCTRERGLRLGLTALRGASEGWGYGVRFDAGLAESGFASLPDSCFFIASRFGVTGGYVGLPPKPAWGFHPQTSSLLRTYGLNRWNRWIAKQSIQEGNPRTSGSWWGLGQRPKKE